MGFLEPLALLAGAAVAVPLLLHLLHRRPGRPVPFPALRYLRRTEEEHAGRIRLRRLLLLALRLLVLIFLVLAAARPWVRGAGGEHTPTALAVVLDNSLSTGRVIGEVRRMDRLRELALRSVDAAGPEDRIWVLRAGEPWEITPPLTPDEALRRIESTEPTDAAADLPATLARAAGLIRSAGRPGGEIHLLADLQASAFPDPEAESAAGDVPVVAYRGALEDLAFNRWVERVEMGHGAAPLANQETEMVVTVGGWGDPGGDTVEVRLVVDGEVRSMAFAPLSTPTVLSFPALPAGRARGHVEIDPDALRADDRRHFSLEMQAAPRVARAGEEAPFLDRALEVLREAQRLHLPGDEEAEVLLVVGGAELAEEDLPPALVVTPPGDPALLPRANRLLSRLEIPWTFGSLAPEGEVELSPPFPFPGLQRIRIRRSAELGSSPPEREEDRILLRLATGEPWAVRGSTGSLEYLLLGSPPDPRWTSLPLDPAMIPFTEWISGRWRSADPLRETKIAGDPLPVPAGANQLRRPDGTLIPVDGIHSVRATGTAGIYSFLGNDGILAEVAVNPPVRESVLEPVSPGVLRSKVGPGLRLVTEGEGWTDRIFQEAGRREVWRFLVFAALLALLAESWLAASGGRKRETEGP